MLLRFTVLRFNTDRIHKTGNYLQQSVSQWRSFPYFPAVKHRCIRQHQKDERQWYAAFCLSHQRWICALGSHGYCYHLSSSLLMQWRGRLNTQRLQKSQLTQIQSRQCLRFLSQTSVAQPSAGRWMELRQAVSLHHFLVLTFSFQLLVVKESFWLHLIQNKIKSWIGISIRFRKCISGCLLDETSDRATRRQEEKIKD